MSRWDGFRDNAGFAMTAVSLVLTVAFGLNVDKVFDVSRPYFVIPYGIAVFALGCLAGWSLKSALSRRKARRASCEAEERAERGEVVHIEKLRQDFLKLDFDNRTLIFACVFEGEQEVGWYTTGIDAGKVRRFATPRDLSDGSMVYTATDDARRMFERFPELKEMVERDLRRS